MPLTLISWNVLAHPHTRHNSRFHGQPATESKPQRDARYATNARILLSSGAHILCLQEADKDFVACLVPHYRVLCHALNGAGEGCAVLVLSAAASELAPAPQTFELALGAGKSAVGVEVKLPAVTSTTDSSLGTHSLWVVSLHLSGGPGEGPQKTRDAQIASISAALAGLASPGTADGSGAGGPVCAAPAPLGVAAVLCGDWNDSQPERLASVAAAGLHVMPAPGPTGLSADFSCAVRIDWIAATSAAQRAFESTTSPSTSPPDAGSSSGAPLAVAALSPVSLRHTPGNPWAEGALLGSDHVPLFVTLRR